MTMVKPELSDDDDDDSGVELLLVLLLVATGCSRSFSTVG